MRSLDEARFALTQGRHLDVLRIAREVLQRDPKNQDAAHLHAIALSGLGHLAEAREAFATALRLAPRSAHVRANWARQLAALGDYDGAAKAFATALELRPGDPLLQSALGNCLRLLGRPEEAEIQCCRAYAGDPYSPEVASNLAAICVARGATAEAEAILNRTLERHHAHPMVLNALAGVLHSRGRGAAALAMLDRIQRPSPADKALRGDILVSMRRFDEAEAAFLAAVAKRPTAELWERIAATRSYVNDLAGVRDAAAETLRLEPGNLIARWILATLFPPVPQSTEETEAELGRWRHDLTDLSHSLDLSSPAKVAKACAAVRRRGNFNVIYQTHEDVPVQTLYGSLLHRIACARFPHLAEPPGRTPRDRPRIGFVSAHFRDHVIMRTHGAWVMDLTDAFDRVVYHGDTRSDAVTAEVAGRVDRFVQELDPEQLVRQIEADAPDVLVYLDHGMHGPLQIPAALWLAPIQCNGLGHPVTSGLPTFTHALSPEFMEPENAQSNYTENLALIPGLGQRYRCKRSWDSGDLVIRDRGDGRVRYLCVQNFQKYMPRHDFIWPELAKQLPRAEFHFVSPGHANLLRSIESRLDRAFSLVGLDWRTYCHIHGSMQHDRWMTFLREGDVFLDALSWSGNNTAPDAIACGLPIVTLPGKVMRSRHVLGILRHLGHMHNVASDVEDYIRIAVRLGEDRDERIWHGMRLWKSRERLSQDPAPVRALEAMFLRLCDR